MDFEALNYVPVPIVVLERADRRAFNYVWINTAAKVFSGLTLDQIIGKNPREVFPGRAGDRLAARQEHAARRGKVVNYLYPISLPRGEVWIETSLVPVRGPDGSVFRLVATMQDRTAERELKEERVKAESEMKLMQSEIENYISMAAHDLRTPMRHVKQIAALLREDFVDHGDGKLDLIEMLEDVGVKANELISEVLNFARSSDSNSDGALSVLDLAQLSSDIFAVLDPRRVFTMSSDSGIIEVDAIALQVALRNLIDNITKHAGKGDVSVHVGLLGEQDGMLKFQVRDNGKGFDDPARAFLGGGEFRYDSGFGLLGVKRIVCGRGGTIHAEAPKDGQGAIIRFSLPGRICNARELEQQTEAAEIASAIRVAAAE